ncbi:MAG: tetratricopeptide repeat family protein [Segetibacter sp.]|nr:tetratricopeptide repeat family protein [Segetibacter sp.]
MKKLTTLLLAFLFTGKLLIAQTADEGRKSLYYGRTTTAKQTLEKAVAANPKNAEAIYWLGQTYLGMEDIAGAKKVYQDALTAGVNEPLVWVGMGHVETLEGKKDAARQRFEAAITATTKKKKEDVNILNAIGRANADGAANIGDPAYAIEKLKRAAELDPTNADVFVNLGMNYLKLGPDQGGNAYEAYTNALKADPNNAKAKFRLGKIFESQGNTDRFLEYYNTAVTGDQAYAPAYLELYDYYANRDVNKAKEYLEKYIANSDKDCSTDAAYADYLFRAGKYQESLERAKAMESGQCKNFPGLKVIYAYNYDRLGDSLQARTNLESYLATVPAEKVKPAIYEFAGNLLLKFPGQSALATSYLEKAMNADTVPANRIKYINTIAESLGKAGAYGEQLNWYRKLAAVKPELSNRDLYLYADAAIRANNFAAADSISRLYIQKYPDQEYGYSLLVRGAKAADSTGAGPFDEIQQYIDFLTQQDAAKNASKIKSQLYYVASTAADKMKDYPKALDAVNKILAVDPADSFATQAKPVLERAVNGKSAGDGGTPKKTTTPPRRTK